MNAPHFLPQKIHQILAALALLIVIVPQSVLASAITPQTIIELVNVERIKNGQSVLSVNAELTKAAYSKADNMVFKHYFDHFGPDGESPWQYILEAGYDYRFAGENLAMDFSQAENVNRAWMNSPTHRDNILDPNFQETGVAVVEGVIGEQNTTLVVQLFGAKQPTLIESLNPQVLLVDYVGEILGITDK